MLRLGIVGLPNVGKSTLFNALTSSKAAAAENYPFCTVEPNVGVVEVPDPRLEQLNALKIGDSLHVRDLSIPNAKILTEADLTIATVVPPRAEEVAAPSPEATTEVAEPELIRKVREGEEEEGEGGTAAEGGAPAKPEAKGAGGGGAAPAKAEKTEKPKGGKES